jgi:orotidine 5'-phosphate decarboxylase subfamily 2
MESFFTFLEKRVDDCASLLCIGLDPHASDLPEPTAKAALDFCLRIVKETAPYAAAFKPNAAFFEFFGSEGWAALRHVIEKVSEQSARLGSRIPVILDAKRGDIASTAEAYAHSAFAHLGADAITLSPYLGKDSIMPFIQDPEKGVFLLCKTSNPGSADLQDLPVKINSAHRNENRMMPHDLESCPVYTYIAYLAGQWNTNKNIGLVVGATQHEALGRLRAAVPGMWFLSPGVGAQGGDLDAALRAGLRKDGKGMLINVSRSIARAENPKLAAAELRDEIFKTRYSLSGNCFLDG